MSLNHGTVGDCYVAATGIPDTRNDDVIKILRFAKEIMIKTEKATRRLEIELGPGTSDLTLRVGIHSGPVTAGVLRGERARFQVSSA